MMVFDAKSGKDSKEWEMDTSEFSSPKLDTTVNTTLQPAQSTPLSREVETSKSERKDSNEGAMVDASRDTDSKGNPEGPRYSSTLDGSNGKCQYAIIYINIQNYLTTTTNK
jgi:hypothetical protein